MLVQVLATERPSRTGKSVLVKARHGGSPHVSSSTEQSVFEDVTIEQFKTFRNNFGSLTSRTSL